MDTLTAENYFTDNKIIPFHTDNIHYQEIYSIMIGFAKTHCEEQAKAFQKLAQENTVWGREKKDEILNKYPLSNIK